MTHYYVCAYGHEVTTRPETKIDRCPAMVGHSHPTETVSLTRVGEGSRKANAERQEVAA